MQLTKPTRRGAAELYVDDDNRILFVGGVPVAAKVRGILYKVSHRGSTRFTPWQRGNISYSLTWWIKYRLQMERKYAIPKPIEWFEDLALKFKPTIGATEDEYAVMEKA